MIYFIAVLKKLFLIFKLQSFAYTIENKIDKISFLAISHPKLGMNILPKSKTTIPTDNYLFLLFNFLIFNYLLQSSYYFLISKLNSKLKFSLSVDISQLLFYITNNYYYELVLVTDSRYFSNSKKCLKVIILSV